MGRQSTRRKARARRRSDALGLTVQGGSIHGVPVGKVLLNDTEWFGSFSLKDSAMMRRFKFYVARSSTQ
jgi:hypothetical protein